MKKSSRSSSPLLSVENLTVSFEKTKIISSASFKIEEGDFVCVVGANGSGKSTLIKALLGLIKIKSGKISYKKGIKRTKIGYLPQESKIDESFPATVFEVVLSGTLGSLGLFPFYKEENKRIALKSLEALNIKKLKDKPFSELSGGQKQKVLLSRALAATSSLLVLDEPSNNLDPASRKDFYATLKRLNKDSNLSIIMITHDLDTEDLIGNKILQVKDGTVSLFSTEDFLRSYKK